MILSVIFECNSPSKQQGFQIAHVQRLNESFIKKENLKEFFFFFDESVCYCCVCSLMLFKRLIFFLYTDPLQELRIWTLYFVSLPIRSLSFFVSPFSSRIRLNSSMFFSYNKYHFTTKSLKEKLKNMYRCLFFQFFLKQSSLTFV